MARLTRFRGVGVLLVLVALCAASTIVTGQPPSEGQSEFVPISELPPADQLPAAPLLVAAYAFVWVVLFVYLWSIWQRLRKVDRDLSALARRVDTRADPPMT